MTPTVPPTTASAPVPKLTSASSRTTSRWYRRSVRGIQRDRAQVEGELAAEVVEGHAARHHVPLLRDDLEVDGGDDEVQREQQHERDDHALVDRVADALRAALGGHALVRGHQRGDQRRRRAP